MDPAPPPQAVKPKSASKLALVGLLLTILSPFPYFFLMHNATVRATAWPTFALMAVGVLLGLVAVRNARTKAPRILASVNIAFVALFVWGFFFLAALPQTSAAALKTAPDFTLKDHDGRPVSLHAALEAGPVLLVFYRGFW